MLDEFHDPERDDPRTKVVDLGNNKLTMKRTDPFGFISVSLERGSVPEYLKGNYTTWEAAKVDVDKYLAERAKVTKEVAQEAPAAELKKKTA